MRVGILFTIVIATHTLAFVSPVVANGETPKDLSTLQPGIQRSDDGVWYLGAQPKATFLKRDHFTYGQVAFDANDYDRGVVEDSDTTPDFDQDVLGGGSDFFLGRRFSEKHAGEVRVGFALLNLNDKKRQVLDGEDNGLNFLLPYLDAGRYPDSDRPRAAGIYGVRFRDRDGPVDLMLRSHTSIADVGLDFVSNHIDCDGYTLQSVIGPAFIYQNQDFHHTVSGYSIGGWGNPTMVRTKEEMKEYYVGAKLGFRTAYAIPKVSRLSVVAHGDVSLFYLHATLDAEQRINDELNIKVSDEINQFATKFGALAGLDFQATENFTIGLFYQFGAYLNAARIDNPNLAVADLEGDNRFVGDHSAHLDDQTLFTHGATVRLVLHF